tara:strand:+ start:212 stop:406 length:195 start_codon:yes stop_codon:yes gene_type:complete
MKLLPEQRERQMTTGRPTLITKTPEEMQHLDDAANFEALIEPGQGAAMHFATVAAANGVRRETS